MFIDLSKHGVAVVPRGEAAGVAGVKATSTESLVSFVAIDEMTGFVVWTRTRVHANPRAAAKFLHEVARVCARSGLPLHIRTEGGPLFHPRPFADACRQLGVVHHVVQPIAPSTRRKASGGSANAAKRRRR